MYHISHIYSFTSYHIMHDHIALKYIYIYWIINEDYRKFHIFFVRQYYVFIAMEFFILLLYQQIYFLKNDYLFENVMIYLFICYFIFIYYSYYCQYFSIILVVHYFHLVETEPVFTNDLSILIQFINTYPIYMRFMELID